MRYLAGFAHVEWHHDRGFELAGERLDVFFCLVVEIGHRKLSSESTESFGAAPSDRIFISNADDEALLAFQQLGFYTGIMRAPFCRPI
jgi:hypothetical protein